MFLSKLLVDVGDRADRNRPGRRWIQQPYRVHQRLCMGFPNEASRADPHFTRPFDPSKFFDHPGSAPEWDASVKGLAPSVHVKRDKEHGFLFRIDQDKKGRPFIIVQSAREPNWEYAFQNASYLILSHLCRPYQIDAVRGPRLRFRLRANPTKKIKTLSKAQRLLKVDKRHGTRAGLLDEISQGNWLEQKGKRGGFRIVSMVVSPEGFRRTFKEEERISLLAVRFDGELEVTDEKKFTQTLIEGVGPGKGLGFGLLSVLPT